MRSSLYMMAFMAVAMLGFAGAVNAQPFTFTSETTGEPVASGVMTPEGMVGTVAFNSSGTTTYADGSSENWTSQCTNSMSPRFDDDAVGFCINTMEGGDTLNVVQVCQNGAVEGEANCWGYFAGGTGQNAKASGTVTWQNNAEGAVGGGNLNRE